MNLNQLIKDCTKQNRKAQEDLYHLYKKTLFVLCLKYCTNEAEAEDNLQDSFIEIFTNIKKFKGTGSFEGWMKRITINKAISSYKKSFLLSPILDNDAVEIEIDEGDFNEISADAILNFIQELPNQYRLVFCLYELDNYSHQEISELLSISIGTSKSNLHKAKVILKQKIQPNSLLNTRINYGK